MSKVHINNLEYTYKIGKMYTVIRCAETGKKIVAKNLEIAQACAPLGEYPIMPRHVRHYLAKLLGVTSDIYPYRVGDLLRCRTLSGSNRYSHSHYLVLNVNEDEMQLLWLEKSKIETARIYDFTRYTEIEILSSLRAR